VRFDDGPPRRPLRMSGAVIDITARKGIADALNASERRQQTLIEGIPQLVWRAGEPGFWTWTSPQWESFTGQVDADSRGWGWLDVVHPIDREQILRLWAAAPERGEFEADYRICERASGRFRWFQTRARPVRDEEGRIVEWLGTSTDVDDLRRLQDRQQVLVSELQHRTRNLMSVVRVTADRSMRRSTTLDEFKLSFHDRLSALARVQGLLSRLEDGDRLTFDTLIRSELSVHGALDSRAEQITLDGPDDVRLRSSTVQTLALAMHELATNAAKYGALKQPQATLSVRWRMAPMVGDDRPWLHVDWRESGVCMPPPDSAPQGGGQGRELIEKALPYQLGARTTYELGADGVYCSILLPVSDSRA
jgi:PAS domain S-box-containing protein